MIVFFVGTPGSGKTYEAVKKIVDNLRMGRVVCTNIDGMDDPVCQQYLKDFLNLDDSTFRGLFRFLSKEQIMKFWKAQPVTKTIHQGSADGLFSAVTETTNELICPIGALIVIDEVHKYYNARDWQASESKELGNWASTHRHDGYDLVLITQSIDKCDKQVRTLTEWTYFFRKINFLGSMVSGRYMKYSYSGDDHDGKPLAKNVATYQGYVFPAYKSYSNADAKEVGFMSHINVLKHPVFMAIPLVLCLCLYMFFAKSSFATGDIFGAKRSQDKFKATQAKNAPLTAPPLPGVSAPVSPAPSLVPSPGAPSPAPGIYPPARPPSWSDLEKSQKPKPTEVTESQIMAALKKANKKAVDIIEKPKHIINSFIDTGENLYIKYADRSQLEFVPPTCILDKIDLILVCDKKS